jgi:tetratricopeptide (TPR) repeat protein
MQGSAQLAEIAPFDTSKNDHAASDRIFADAVKEAVLGNSKEAESLMLRFIEANPNVGAAYYELARINAKENNPAKAQEYIAKAIKLDSANKWYKEVQGNLWATSNKFLEAANVFAQLAQQYKPNEDYLLKASLLFQRAQQYDKAINALEVLVRDHGPEEDLMLQIKQLYLKRNDVPHAVATLRRLIDANPKEGRYYALLAELYSDHKQTEQAKAVFDEAEQKCPNDLAIQLGLASYYKAQNKSAQYKDYINKAIGNSSIDEQTQLTLLVSFLQDMQKDTSTRADALSLTESVAKRYPHNAVLLGIYGDLLSVNNKQAEAMLAYKQSLAIDSANLNVWQQLLFSMSDKPFADSLLFYCEAALRMYPSAAMLYYLNGIGYANKNNFTKAIQSFTTAVDYQPEDNKDLLAEMYASLADAYNSDKQYALADKNFDAALKLTPNNATVLNNYAYYLSVRKERLDDALRYSEKSLQIRPGEATFLDTYGWICFQMAQYEKAKEYIQQAIDKNGTQADATLYEHLGDVYYKLNQLDKALINWRLAQTKDPNNERILQKIKQKKIDE